MMKHSAARKVSLSEESVIFDQPPLDEGAGLAHRLAVDKTLKLYTDFVCPFCFIAEQSSVPRILRDLDLTLDWRGFELHPSTPVGGKPLASLFPGVDLNTLHQRTIEFARGFGVTDFRPPNWLSNTRRVLAASEFARERGRLELFRRAAFSANFREGLDLEAPETLADLARQAILDPDEVLSAAESPIYLARIDEVQNEARREGVSGIPTFVLNGRRLVGCQPYERVMQFATAAMSA